MGEKKVIKKVKRSDKEEEKQGPSTERTEKPQPQPKTATAAPDVRPKDAQTHPEDYEVMKKKYIELKKRYDELEKAFNRIGTLEQDIKKVHEKLDNFDTNSANVQKDLAVVKGRVANIQKDMKAISVVAANISRTYGFDIKVQLPPTGSKSQPSGQPPAKPQVQQNHRPAPPPVQRPPLAPANQPKPSPALNKGAKALVMAKNAEKGLSRPATDEITAEARGRGRAPEPKDHRDATERMDDVVVTGDDDMDTVDYVIRPDGKKVPISRKKVEEELKQPKDED